MFWVVDNGSSHARLALDRPDGASLADRDLVHLPVHASWLNQIEIYFSILQRKAITPGRLRRPRRTSPQRILAFQDRYNTTAEPFDWRYTRDDLNTLPHPTRRGLTPDELNGR